VAKTQDHIVQSKEFFGLLNQILVTIIQPIW